MGDLCLGYLSLPLIHVLANQSLVNTSHVALLVRQLLLVGAFVVFKLIHVLLSCVVESLKEGFVSLVFLLLVIHLEILHVNELALRIPPNCHLLSITILLVFVVVLVDCLRSWSLLLGKVGVVEVLLPQLPLLLQVNHLRIVCSNWTLKSLRSNYFVD